MRNDIAQFNCSVVPRQNSVALVSQNFLRVLPPLGNSFFNRLYALGPYKTKANIVPVLGRDPQAYQTGGVSQKTAP